MGLGGKEGGTVCALYPAPDRVWMFSEETALASGWKDCYRCQSIGGATAVAGRGELCLRERPRHVLRPRSKPIPHADRRGPSPSSVGRTKIRPPPALLLLLPHPPAHKSGLLTRARVFSAALSRRVAPGVGGAGWQAYLASWESGWQDAMGPRKCWYQTGCTAWL